MSTKHKPLVWLHEQPKTPPLSQKARIETGFLLRLLQLGVNLSLPQSRPMPFIGDHCHELRIQDENKTWRLFYRVDADAIVVILWIEKKTKKTPDEVINLCQKRLKFYDMEN
ncbi:type II toxin-antitoxin system RelE/ParE family toxin [Fibrobacter sp.]|uniref:type II toxin-antitoxin system RelE/ParE family toxin n=1 Tax=Fibrobacter sp. TaxID=35828 RepID=UPI003867171F